MGAPDVPKPKAPPARPDTVKAQLQALSYAQTQKQLRKSSGRRAQFTSRPQNMGTSVLLGQ